MRRQSSQCSGKGVALGIVKVQDLPHSLYLNFIFILWRVENSFTDVFAYPIELIQVTPEVLNLCCLSVKNFTLQEFGCQR